MTKKKLIRITTVPGSLRTLLKGQPRFMVANGFEVIGVSSDGTALYDIEKNEGIRTVAIEMTRKVSPLKDFKSLIQFYQLCKMEKPTIVHSHTPKAGIVGMLGARLAGVPIRLHTVAGLPLMEETGIKRKILNWIEKLTYRCATKVYPNSIGLYNFIIQQRFANPKKLKVIGKGSSNGIDTSYFDPRIVKLARRKELRTELGLIETDFIFLFVGRLVTDKGINELIFAFDQISKKHTNCYLLLVGQYENDLDPLLEATEETIKRNARIHTVGYKSNINEYFAISDVLTFPSYREGFPNVVMQAAAMELNAIVSDINGCNEIIRDGANGWIIPVKNRSVLQERMEWCLNNREISKRMGMKGRDIILRDFDRKYIWEKVLEEYQSQLLKIDGNRSALC